MIYQENCKKRRHLFLNPLQKYNFFLKYTNKICKICFFFVPLRRKRRVDATIDRYRAAGDGM